MSLLVVDEAHCISEWGHDFRPDYLRIGPLVERLGSPTVLALTATASPPVRREIVERLRMRDPELIVRGFDRPNIRLEVDRHHDERHKRRALVERVAALERPGTVYVATRKLAEEVAQELDDVTHGEWGEGVVLRYDGDHVVVLFDSVGYRTLSVELVTERGLLDTAS